MATVVGCTPTMAGSLAAAQGSAATVDPAPVQPAAALTIPATYRLIEGIASDGSTLWFSSVVDRKIVEYRDGRYRDFGLPAGLGAPLGIAYDATRKWLWIAANCPDGLPETGCQGAALIGMDRKGRVRVAVRPTAGARFAPGDVSAWRDRIFVSDSLNGAFYTCAAACRSLTTLIPPRQKGSAQGSVAYDGGRKVLLADYSLGVISIDLKTRVETKILREDGKPLRGVDGLTADGDTFLGVRNFDVPGMVVRFRVQSDKITDLSVAAAGGAIHDPTQITRSVNQILVVGDGQWGSYLADKDGKRSGIQKPTPIAGFAAMDMNRRAPR